MIFVSNSHNMPFKKMKNLYDNSMEIYEIFRRRFFNLSANKSTFTLNSINFAQA